MTEEARLQIHLQIHGRVQGVGFRYFTVQTARELALTGWVRNRRDGSVEVLAIGKPADLQTFQSRLKIGPPTSGVTEIVAETKPATSIYSAFEARSTE